MVLLFSIYPGASMSIGIDSADPDLPQPGIILESTIISTFFVFNADRNHFFNGESKNWRAKDTEQRDILFAIVDNPEQIQKISISIVSK